MLLFLALKIVEAWHLDIEKTIIDWSVFATIVEEIIEDFPRKINSFGDVSLHYDVAEAKNILSKHSLIKDVEINILTKNTKVLSNEGREDMLKAFIKLNEAVIMVCPPYISVVGKRNTTYFVIDTRVIRKHIGGNGNGTVIEFSNTKSCITWITKRLVLSGVKASAPQDNFKSIFHLKKMILYYKMKIVKIQNKSKVMKEVIQGMFNPAGRKTKN